MPTPINIPITIDPPDLGGTVNAFKELKNQLRDQINVLATLTAGTDEYIAQAARVGSIRDQVNELNDSIRATSGAPIENLSSSFGLLSGQVSNLDFDGAATSLRQFGANAGQIKFKDLTDGLKTFGKVAFDVGKSILLNPLFLIPALIIGIGAALFALKDKIKIIGDAFDFISNEIGKAVQTLKDFGDLIGLTNFAAEEAAEKAAANAAKATAAITERYDTEIKLAKAAGKDVTKLEQEKGEAVRASIKEQIRALVLLALQNGKYSEEQLKQLEEFKKAYKDSLVESTVANLEAQTKRTEDNKKAYTEQLAANKTLQKQIEDLHVQSIKDENDRAEAKLLLDYQRGIKEIEQSKALKSLKNEALLALQLDYESKLAAIEQKKTDDAFAQLTAEADKKKADDDAKLKQDQLDFDNLAIQLQAESDAKIASEQKTKEQIDEINKQKQDNAYAITQQGLTAIQGLSDLFFEIQNANVKKGSVLEEQQARQRFKINKALQLSNAVMQGIQGVQAAYASGSAIPVIGAVAGPIYAIAAAAVAAGNVAKIAGTQFNNTGFASSVQPEKVDESKIKAAAGPSPQSTAFNPSTVGQVGTPGAQNASNQPQRVYVVESDITKVQSKVAITESQASF